MINLARANVANLGAKFHPEYVNASGSPFSRRILLAVTQRNFYNICKNRKQLDPSAVLRPALAVGLYRHKGILNLVRQ